MKGKNAFSQREISELRNLIKERIKADKSRQKSIRARMRRIGFYGSHDFGIIDLQPADFERLISSGRIKVLGQRPILKKEQPKQTVKENSNQDKAQKLSENFTLFDPEKHPSDHISDKPGNYIVCLKNGSELPDIGMSYDMKTYLELNAIYTGIAGKSLRKRDYRQHFTGNNSGRSTLRKSLGSMFGYAKIARDRDPSTGKTKFNESDEKKLSEWMQSNLLLYFKSNPNPHILEDELISELNPPLNLDKNKSIINKDFRSKLSELRCKK